MSEQIRADPEIKRIMEGDTIMAGHKIEITFGPGRSGFKEYPALIQLWESGKHFHGGGDELMYFCLDVKTLRPDGAWKMLLDLVDKKAPTNRLGCGHPIPGHAIGGGAAFCPNCKKGLNSDRLTGQLPFWGTTQDLARFTARYFDVLKQDADVYCKYHPTDIRYKTMEQEKGLETARRLRGMFIYPLNRILKDTAGGATLESRFRAFYNA